MEEVEEDEDEEFEEFQDIENIGSVEDLELNEDKSEDDLGILIFCFLVLFNYLTNEQFNFK